MARYAAFSEPFSKIAYGQGLICKKNKCGNAERQRRENRGAAVARRRRRREAVECGEKFSSQNGEFWCNMKQWLFYTPQVWGKLLALGRYLGWLYEFASN